MDIFTIIVLFTGALAMLIAAVPVAFPDWEIGRRNGADGSCDD